MSDAEPVPTKTWTRFEYDRLVEAEILGSEDRLELLGGATVVKEPQDSPPATAISLVHRALTTALGSGWYPRAQMPVALDDESEPEPDVCRLVRSEPTISHGISDRASMGRPVWIACVCGAGMARRVDKDDDHPPD